MHPRKSGSLYNHPEVRHGVSGAGPRAGAVRNPEGTRGAGTTADLAHMVLLYKRCPPSPRHLTSICWETVIRNMCVHGAHDVCGSPLTTESLCSAQPLQRYPRLWGEASIAGQGGTGGRWGERWTEGWAVCISRYYGAPCTLALGDIRNRPPQFCKQGALLTPHWGIPEPLGRSPEKSQAAASQTPRLGARGHC